MLVATISSLRTKGMASLSDDMGGFSPDMIDFDEAMNKRWNTDKFLLNYQVSGEESWYRLNKSMLSVVRQHGQRISTDRIVLDYDNPNKDRWTPELLEDTLERFMDACDAVGPWANDWEYLYTTRSGLRIIYHLDNQIAVDDLELRVQWISGRFSEQGFEFDANAMDWTRCFRLPYVVREGVKSWASPTFTMLDKKGTIISTENLGRSDKFKPAPMANLDMPDTPMVELIENHNGQRLTATIFARKAKVRMKDTDHYGILFGHEPLAAEGGRHMTISRLIGSCVNKLFRIEISSPHHIWALVHPAIAQLEPDSETPCWFSVTWRMICEFWAKEQEKADRWARERAELEERKNLVKEGIVEGMRSWCDEPVLESADPEECWEWISRRLMLLQGRSLFVLKPNGHYDDFPISKDVLPNKIRDLGMDCVIQLKKMSKSGEIQDVAPDSIVRNHGIQIAGCLSVGTPSLGGILYKNFLEINTFRRRSDITPHFDERVDEWLTAMFGKHKRAAVEWIAQSLAWEEGPICALSIYGPRGTGKQMLARGLAEATVGMEYAPSKCITGDFQEALLRCPFIVVNEGWPTGARSFNAADRFRELTAGDPTSVNIKYMPAVTVSMPYRILMMANNRDVVFEIAGKRDLSVEDREALAERILHLEIDDGGRKWIDSRGGRAFTDGWIQGTSRSSSNFTLARHFLYLYENCRTGYLRSSRFLVAGSQTQQIIRDMRKRVGSAGLVVEACIQAMTITNLPGLHIDDDFYLVTAQTIRELLKKENYQLSASEISTALKGVSNQNFVSVITGKNNDLPVRWYELDCKLLLEQAEDMGFNYPKRLKKIADSQ